MERLEEISVLIANNLKFRRFKNIFHPADLHKGKGISEGNGWSVYLIGQLVLFLYSRTPRCVILQLQCCKIPKSNFYVKNYNVTFFSSPPYPNPGGGGNLTSGRLREISSMNLGFLSVSGPKKTFLAW
jgi:hypothetical protein